MKSGKKAIGPTCRWEGNIRINQIRIYRVGAMSCERKALGQYGGIISSRFLAKGHLSRASRQARLSANDMCDHEIISGLCTISWHLLYNGIKPRKTSARRPSDEGCATSHVSNGVPYLQMRSGGLHSTSGSRKKGKGRVGTLVIKGLYIL